MTLKGKPLMCQGQVLSDILDGLVQMVVVNYTFRYKNNDTATIVIPF